jgi:hypothetical protein
MRCCTGRAAGWRTKRCRGGFVRHPVVLPAPMRLMPASDNPPVCARAALRASGASPRFSGPTKPPQPRQTPGWGVFRWRAFTTNQVPDKWAACVGRACCTVVREAGPHMGPGHAAVRRQPRRLALARGALSCRTVPRAPPVAGKTRGARARDAGSRDERCNPAAQRRCSSRAQHTGRLPRDRSKRESSTQAATAGGCQCAWRPRAMWLFGGASILGKAACSHSSSGPRSSHQTKGERGGKGSRRAGEQPPFSRGRAAFGGRSRQPRRCWPVARLPSTHEGFGVF